MEGDGIGRRGFLAAGAIVSSSALLDACSSSEQAAASAGPSPARPSGGVSFRAMLDPTTVNQVQLDDTGFKSSRQEGGATVMAGTFTPEDSTVVVAIDIAGLFSGWGGGYFGFNIGVLPASPPAPWEPGGLNRITQCNHSSRSPLPGVTEYGHYPVGIANANTIGAQVERTIILEGLTPAREYQWELRCGGLSYFKQYQFADGSQPTRIVPTADDLYAWVTLAGSSKLALLQLGWSELWQLFGQSQEMICVAEVQLAGPPSCIGLQPGGTLLATVDESANTLVLVDTESLAITGTYNAPPGVTLSTTELVFSADGAKIYAGGWSDGRLHRFDVATTAWDQSTVIDAGGTPALLLLDLSADGRFLWCSSFWNRKVFRVDLQPSTPSPTLVYTTPAGSAGPVAGAVRNSDGSIVFTDPTNNLLRHVSGTGTLLHTWSSTITGQGTQNARSSVRLDEDEVRAFWTDDGVIGWAWIDSANVINATHSFFPDPVYGDVHLTSNEGTLLALPTTDLVVQWPGGHMTISPSHDDPVVYGADHAHITFTGAAATRA